MKISIGERTIQLLKGDITDLELDCIVNAANSNLRLGGGVAGAIRRKGGPQIQKECDEIISQRGPIPTGQAAITTGGDLKAKYVVHAVGPVHGEDSEDKKLRNATVNSLKLAEKTGLRSIAFPAISTGVFGFPKQRCAEIMLSEVISYLTQDTTINQVVFCLFDEESFSIFRETLERIHS